MNKELKQKLRDAGFDSHFGDCQTCGVNSPTLSELIEACGDDFYSLQHNQSKVPGEWYVIYKSKEPHPPAFYSNTPEESVANLWLRLNVLKDNGNKESSKSTE